MTRLLIEDDVNGLVIRNTEEQTWISYSETFFEMLLGIGFSLPGTPEEMAGILDDFHAKKMHEKYGTSL